MLSVGLLPGPFVYLLGLGTHWWLLPSMLAMGILCMFDFAGHEAYEYFHAKPSTVLGVYYLPAAAARYFPAIVGALIDKFNFSVAFTVIGAGFLPLP